MGEIENARVSTAVAATVRMHKTAPTGFVWNRHWWLQNKETPAVRELACWPKQSPVTIPLQTQPQETTYTTVAVTAAARAYRHY